MVTVSHIPNGSPGYRIWLHGSLVATMHWLCAWRQHRAGVLEGHRSANLPYSRAVRGTIVPHRCPCIQVSVSACTFAGNTALVGGGMFVSSGSRCRESAGCYRLVVDAGTTFRGEHGYQSAARLLDV